MSPLYLSRVETVLSFQQLASDASVCAAAAATAADAAMATADAVPALIESRELEPEVPLAQIAGARIAHYRFAAPSNGGNGGADDSPSSALAGPRQGGGTMPRCSSTQGLMAPHSAAAMMMGDRADGACAAAAVSGMSDDDAAHDHDGDGGCDGAGSALNGASSGSASDGDCGVLDARGALPARSLLDGILLAMWEDCAEHGLFRYDVTACPTRVLPGVYGFVAQLNEGRATQKRPTECRVDAVVQPFDAAKFNFTKAYAREALFAFEERAAPSKPPRGTAVAAAAAPVGGAAASTTALAPPSRRGAPPPTASYFDEAGVASPSPNLVIINVSPIEYGHVLLCPRVLDRTPQLLDPSTVRLALAFAAEAGNPYFRVGYNSLGAYATINHLHFQAYYLGAPLPCERAPTAPIAVLPPRRPDGVRVTRLVDFPVAAFCLEMGDAGADALADAVGAAALAMQAANVAHNLMLCDGGARAFLFPQCYAEKQARGLVPDHLLATGVNPACWEIAGHMVLKRAEDYDAFSQELAWELLAAVSVDDDAFDAIARDCFGDAPSAVAARARAQLAAAAAAEAAEAAAVAAVADVA